MDAEKILKGKKLAGFSTVYFRNLGHFFKKEEPESEPLGAYPGVDENVLITIGDWLEKRCLDIDKKLEEEKLKLEEERIKREAAEKETQVKDADN